MSPYKLFHRIPFQWRICGPQLWSTDPQNECSSGGLEGEEKVSDFTWWVSAHIHSNCQSIHDCFKRQHDPKFIPVHNLS